MKILSAIAMAGFGVGWAACWTYLAYRIMRWRKAPNAYLVLVTGGDNNEGFTRRPQGYFKIITGMRAGEMEFEKAVIEMMQEKPKELRGVKVRLVRFECHEVLKTFAL